MFVNNGFQNINRMDCFPGAEKTSQCLVNKIQAFVLGRIQQLEVLLDGGGLGRILKQLVVGHSESCGGVHVVGVFVIDKRTRLADE